MKSELEKILTTALKYLEVGFEYKEVTKIIDMGYMLKPASAHHHLARKGGLAEHSMNVVDMLREMKAFDDVKSCYRVGMLHDLVKCVCYREIKTGLINAGTWEYVQPPYPGHGVASVMIAYELGISLKPEEIAAITWHMGAFGLDDRRLKEYNAAIRRWPREIILTHAADHLASATEECEND